MSKRHRFYAKFSLPLKSLRGCIQNTEFVAMFQPPVTGLTEVVVPPVKEELQGMILVGVKETSCHLSFGPKYSASACVVFPLVALAWFTSRSTTSLTEVMFPAASVRV